MKLCQSLSKVSLNTYENVKSYGSKYKSRRSERTHEQRMHILKIMSRVVWYDSVIF